LLLSGMLTGLSFLALLLLHAPGRLK
jgi:hypothetical protein